MCEAAWALVVVTVMGVFSGTPHSRTLIDGISTREACLQLRDELHLVELSQRVVCVPRNVQ